MVGMVADWRRLASSMLSSQTLCELPSRSEIDPLSPIAVRLRICPPRSGFQPSDIKLHHLEHRFGHAFGLFAIRITHQLAQPLGRDLPTQAPAVPEPAALLHRPALFQGVPKAIDLDLFIALDDDREAMVESVKRACFDGPIALIADREGRHLDAACWAARIVRRHGRGPSDR